MTAPSARSSRVSAPDVAARLGCSPGALALLVERGLLRPWVRRLPYPTWDGVLFTSAAVASLAMEEVARAQRDAPVFTTPMMARAMALGRVLNVLENPPPRP